MIWLPEFLCVRLAPWLEAHPQGRIFPVTKHCLYHEMERGCQQSGVEKIRIHDLRHPYVKHTTKNKSLQRQKSQTINFT